MVQRVVSIFVCIAVAAIPVASQAQVVEEDSDLPSRMPNGASFDPDKATAPIRLVEGPGWKAGEDTTLHPVVGIETGFISNVFYTNATNCTAARDCVHAAGLIRALAQIGVGSLNPTRLTPSDVGPVDPVTEEPGTDITNPGSFQYRADLRAAYDQMLSPDGTVDSTGGFSLGATLKAVVNPVGPLTLLAVDDYERELRAANFETDVDTNRDVNNLWLRLPYHPRDRSYGGFLYYTNSVDVFERESQQFPDRMSNIVGVHPTWHVLPQTRIFLDLSQGFITGIGSASEKVTSYPTSVSIGAATLLTPSITVNASFGYSWLNYQEGATTNNFHGGAAIGYRYSPLGRVVLQYVREYQDSINANFYSDDVIRLWAYQRLGPFVLSIQPEVHFRTYYGTIVTGINGEMTRSDDIVSVIAGISYNLRNRFDIGLDYRYTDVSTDFKYMTDGVVIDPSYERHALLLGVRAAL